MTHAQEAEITAPLDLSDIHIFDKKALDHLSNYLNYSPNGAPVGFPESLAKNIPESLDKLLIPYLQQFVCLQ